VLIQISLPPKWWTRDTFRSKKIMLSVWLLLGCLLTMAYKSTLLSTLILLKYEKTIETIDDLDRSGKPLLVSGLTIVELLIKSDPRQLMQDIYHNKSIVFPFNGVLPKWSLEMYVPQAIYIYKVVASTVKMFVRS
jgi:hypothetical protein